MSELVTKWLLKMRDPETGGMKEICITADKAYIDALVEELEQDGEYCELEEVYVHA